MERFVYLCEDSLEGIFTAVYQAYEERHGHDSNRIQILSECMAQELFTTYISVKTDFDKAIKVANTLQRKRLYDVYENIQKAALSCYEDKADVIYRIIILALNKGEQVLEHLTHPQIQRLMELVRYTNNELLRQKEFLRFQELKSGILFARINPNNAVLPFMAEHFTDRFPEENWVIADTAHGGVLVHKRGKGCALMNLEDVDLDAITLELSQGEEAWQRLWKRYVDSIAIKERINPNLQRQMLPLRYRKYMVEF